MYGHRDSPEILNLKQDLIDLENVQQLPSIETTIRLLRKRVGSPAINQWLIIFLLLTISEELFLRN